VSCFPKGKDLQELVDAMAQVESGTKHATAVLDPATPVPFTAEDVGRAFQLQRSHRAKGKLVVAVHSE
jgi:6-phosphogluconate dehydrogenase (decarboxylating)